MPPISPREQNVGIWYKKKTRCSGVGAEEHWKESQGKGQGMKGLEKESETY